MYDTVSRISSGAHGRTRADPVDSINPEKLCAPPFPETRFRRQRGKINYRWELKRSLRDLEIPSFLLPPKSTTVVYVLFYGRRKSPDRISRAFACPHTIKHHSYFSYRSPPSSRWPEEYTYYYCYYENVVDVKTSNTLDTSHWAPNQDGGSSGR